MSQGERAVCEQGWEALRADLFPGLLAVPQASFQWRVLAELIARPLDSPAVRRVLGRANIETPVAELLADLDPDGVWRGGGAWRHYNGSAWRLMQAVALGADPEDPRLRRAGDHFLAETAGRGGFATGAGTRPEPCPTARALEALGPLGLARDLRFEEALAWLEEQPETSAGGGWICGHENHQLIEGNCAVTAAALSAAFVQLPESRRHGLRERALRAVGECVVHGSTAPAWRRFGHPNLLRTDLVELLAILARSRRPYEAAWSAALELVQEAQDDGAWWHRGHPAPRQLELEKVGRRSPWITLRASQAVLHYAVPARLPRLFPQKPAYSE